MRKNNMVWAPSSHLSLTWRSLYLCTTRLLKSLIVLAGNGVMGIIYSKPLWGVYSIWWNSWKTNTYEYILRKSVTTLFIQFTWKVYSSVKLKMIFKNSDRCLHVNSVLNFKLLWVERDSYQTSFIQGKIVPTVPVDGVNF